MLAHPRGRAEGFWNPAKRLLLEPGLVERAEGAALKIGAVQKHSGNPLFGEDKPWEVRFDNLYANVMFDEQERIFKCWYNPFLHYQKHEMVPRDRRATTDYASVPQREPEMGVCYATSHDGLAWEKPELGLVEYNGSMRNNILLRNRPAPSLWRPHGSGVWKDLRDADPARRYKIFFSRPGNSMCVAFSADGVHWGEPIACPEIASRGDCHNNTFWAPSLERYVGITRNFDNRERTRLVARTESPDFLHWTRAEEVLRHAPSEPLRQTYTMIAFPYADAYLGLLMLLNRGDRIDRSDPHNDTVDCELAWSRDTVRWERILPGSPLIPRGALGAVDSGCIYAAAYPVAHNGELRLYYGGNNGKHTDWRDGFLNLARLRPDGFAGMEAPAAGWLFTRPMAWEGAALRISADAPGGSVVAKILEGERVAGESLPATGTLHDAAVAWRKPVRKAAAGRPVRLRFELHAATLYSFSLG